MRTSLIGILLATLASAASVTTGGYSNTRTNATLAETRITRANASLISLQGSYAVDGAVYAQPLVVENIGGKTLLIIATMNDSIYAFDASKPGSAYLWKTTVATALTTDPANPDYSQFPNAQIGCLATPVIDVPHAAVFDVCLDSNTVYKLYSLNLLDGSTYHAAVTVAGTVSSVAFASPWHTARSALLLSSGTVYIAFAGFGNEGNPYNGWVFGYDAVTLANTHTWCNTCASAGNGAGIWMAGGGLAADSLGNVYLITGNGDWNGTTQFGESFVKLNSSLTVLDYFTPTNWSSVLNAGDVDLGSGRAVLIGDAYVLGAGKDSRMWLLNTAAMGALQSTNVGPVQEWDLTSTLKIGAYAFADGALFTAGTGHFYRYTWSGATFTTTPAATVVVDTGYGSTIAYSANGTVAGTGIIWVTTCNTACTEAATAPGVLRALRSDTLVELWNSGATLDNLAKFAPPTVANGLVYVSTFSNAVQVFGISPSSTVRGLVITRGSVVVR